MKASELSIRLQALIAAHGDLEVGVIDSEFSCYDPVFEVGAKEASPRGDQFMSYDAEELGDFFIFIR